MANETEGKPDEGVAVDTDVDLATARASLSDLVLRAGYGNERIPITRHGKRTAVLIGLRDLERLEALDAA